MEIPAQSEHFTPLQHSLLRMFASGIPEEDLLEIRQLLSDYLAKKATEAADQASEGKDIEAWNQKILGEHLRSSSSNVS